MDFVTILIMGSIIASTLLMIIGPLMEFRGKIFFLESKRAPVTSKRYGMRVMTLGAIMFIGGCILRDWISGQIITVIVLGGYAVWFIGGFIAVIRNEVIKMLEEEVHH